MMRVYKLLSIVQILVCCLLSYTIMCTILSSRWEYTKSCLLHTLAYCIHSCTILHTILSGRSTWWECTNSCLLFTLVYCTVYYLIWQKYIMRVHKLLSITHALVYCLLSYTASYLADENIQNLAYCILSCLL